MNEDIKLGIDDTRRHLRRLIADLAIEEERTREFDDAPDEFDLARFRRRATMALFCLETGVRYNVKLAYAEGEVKQ